MLTRKMVSGSLLAGVALMAAPAMAQDSDRYFDGFYVGGAVAAEAPEDSRNDRFVFDTNRDGNFNNSVTTLAGDDAFSTGFCDGNALGADRAAGCSDDGIEIGYAARIGYDARIGDGPFVAGLLVEGAKPGVKDFTTAFSTTPASYTIESEIDYSVMARGRLGFSPGDGRGLFYVTGGVGYARVENNFTTTNGANSFVSSNDRDWQFGAQVGGGAEIMLTRNIGLGMEYLYSKYDNDDYVVAVGPGTAPATNPFLLASGGTNLANAENDLDYHSLRATLNFHF